MHQRTDFSALRTLLIAICIAAAPTVAVAQDGMYMGAFTDAGAIMADIAGDAAVSKSIRDDVARRQNGRTAAQRVAYAPERAAAPLVFRRDPAVTARVRSEMASAMRAKDATAAERFLRSSAGVDFERTLAAQGLSSRNLADVSTYLVGVYWAATHQRTAPPDGRSLKALRAQMGQAVAARASGRLRGLDDAQKQRIADDMLFRAHTLATLMRGFQARPDAGAQAGIARAARQHIRDTMGIDLSTYRLTDRGFVR